MAATYRQHRECRTVRAGALPMVARMAQPAGHVYSVKTRADYVLGMRVTKDKDRDPPIDASDVSGWMVEAGLEWVPERTVRHWVQREPDLPEKLVDGKFAGADDFLEWARPYLRTGSRQAEMRQTSPAPSSLIRSSVGLGLVVAGVYVVVGVSRAVAGGRRSPRDPGPYRRPRRAFRFAR